MSVSQMAGTPDQYPVEIDTFDSHLSGEKCAKLYHEFDGIECAALLDQCQQEGIDQITIFIQHTRANVRQMFEAGFRYLTSKVTYEKPWDALTERVRPSSGVIFVPFEHHHLDHLIDLAFIVGEKSRYYLDADCPDLWRKAYRQWAINGVKGYVTDVLIALDEVTEIPVGFIFMKDRDKTSTVNLIAVDGGYRRKHIGSNLLVCGEEESLKRGIERFDVTTEAENVPAQSLYQRHGYKIRGHHLVYQKKFSGR